MLLPRRELPMPLDDQSNWLRVFCAWVIATSATLGALFLGEIVHLPTCDLCWYQRIFMFPLALILALGLFPLDRGVIRYTLPLAAIGWLMAAYQQLLVMGIIPEDLRPCTQGVPCTKTVIEWFGFVTIPLLSLVAFSAIILLLFFSRKRST